LDEDEAEFLDEVLESTRAEEARVKKETAEGLQAFRKQQEEADKKAREHEDSGTAEGSPEAREEWVATGGRKRKRVKEKGSLKGVKVPRSSTGGNISQAGKVSNDETSRAHLSRKPTDAESVIKNIAPASKSTSQASSQKLSTTTTKSQAVETKESAKSSGLGLVDYRSDDDN